MMRTFLGAPAPNLVPVRLLAFFLEDNFLLFLLFLLFLIVFDLVNTPDD
jgi:hypothetical protein